MPEPDVPEVAADQMGVFTRRQAVAEGWSPRQASRRRAAGRWKLVAGDGLAGAGVEIGAWQLAFAVGLTWPGAVISHEVAGVLHGFPGLSLTGGTATVAHARALHAHGLEAHRTPLAADEVGLIGGLAATTELRTAADLLATAGWDEARSLWAWLVTRDRMTLADLEAAVARRQRRRGTPQLARLLDVSRGGSLSVAEDRFHALMARAAIGGWRANAPVRVGGRVFVVDALFEAARLVVEIDGYGSHSQRAAFQRDRTRQNQLVAAGYVVLRFTWEDLTRRPADVVRAIRAALASSGFPSYPLGG
jgi:very-short-patch-repair endonuclease